MPSSISLHPAISHLQRELQFHHLWFGFVWLGPRYHKTRGDGGLGTAAGRASRAAGAVRLLVLLLRRNQPGDIFMFLCPLLLLYLRELLRAGVWWPTRASRPFWWSTGSPWSIWRAPRRASRAIRWSTRPSRWTSPLLISLQCKSCTRRPVDRHVLLDV